MSRKKDQRKKLFNDVGTVTDFLCLGDRTKTGGECEVGVAFKSRISWVKF